MLPAIVSVILLAMYMESKDDDEEEDTSLVFSLVKTCSKLNSDQALLIPITVWSGVEQAFMMSVFSGELSADQEFLSTFEESV